MRSGRGSSGRPVKNRRLMLKRFLLFFVLLGLIYEGLLYMPVMFLHPDSYMLGYGLTSGLLRAYNFDDSPSTILGAFVVDLEFVGD